MTFMDAYRAERKCWDWSRIPEPLIMAFCFCLSLRLQGIDPDVVFQHSKKTKIQPKRRAV